MSLTELHFGDFPPRIQRAQLVQDRSLNEDLVVQVDFDLVYQGGITLTIEVELAAGVLVPVTVLVTGFMGKLRLRLPRPENATEFNISFVTDPNLTLQVQSRFVRNDNEYSLFQNQLNSFLAKKLQSIFVDTWTLPVWRFFDLPLVSMPTFVHVRISHVFFFFFFFVNDQTNYSPTASAISMHRSSPSATSRAPHPPPRAPRRSLP